MIESRQVGRSGLRVSALALGTMTFGTSTTYMKGVTAEDGEARRILDCALDRGVTLIDTANSYSQGRCETLLGQWLGAKRGTIVLASKCGLAIAEGMQPGPYRTRGLSRSHIIESCEASLRRLQTDHLDLYQMHMQDIDVPIDETLRACEDLVRSGKVRYVGCSNYTGYRLMEAGGAARREDVSPYIALQMQWSLANRDAEREMVPAARALGLGMIIWSPLARGFLSGKVIRGQAAPAGSRLAAWSASLAALDHDRAWDTLAMVERIARDHETTPSAVAIAWVLCQAGVASVLIGARTVAQFEANFAALDVKLSAADLVGLATVSQPAWGYPYDFISQFQSW
jgi:aryl-alcohol dehydrogenase-like predicted oxidoreductase